MSLVAQIRSRQGGFTLDAALTVEAGGVTALFGPSGAGKSSFIHAVGGLIPQAEGRVTLNGRALLDTADGVRLPPHRRRVGIVFQEGRLFPHLSVRGNLKYGARRAGLRRARAGQAGAATDNLEGSDLIGALGIAPLLDRRPATLSGGERQRVALGRALLSEPEALLLDEPLAALDAPRRAEILPYFERLKELRPIPILYVTHSTEEIVRLADRVVALEAGRVTADGSLEEVFSALDFMNGGGDFEPMSALTATVVGQDEAHGLTDLKIGETALAAPAFPAAPGATARLRIKARDVMIALDRPERVSANNVLPAEIVRCAVTDATATVEMRCEGQLLVARITRRAFDRLELAEGLSVYAVIKTVTIAR